MLLKIVVLLLLAIILYCLGSGVFFLIKEGSSTRLAKALTWRIGLSFCLFILLMVAHWFGWITPHAVYIPATE